MTVFKLDDLIPQNSSDSGVKADISSSSPNTNNLSASEEAQMRAARKCKNYNYYVNWFNRLSFLVASTVCRVRELASNI